ncbi:helix-hairpin-helix domain-containing protein [Aeromicrobium sp. Marseille-Q0843]|uniref:Helix-hairpin-helix domain-containing protein n=1 Tax=Aeromicrobium phoceense TaxID=2754045 RepID=A0A838XEX0_9ACTN|nr:helix-hairpin-helix domain-containing protein [Aeromicrobium phoceense]MBA4608482.1 helix-hairpin-helix domain-containing protein [Aeromicrobium phoceense]
MAPVPPETRAQVARQRLAELAATFDATLPDPDRPPPGRRRRPDLSRRLLRPGHVRFAAVVGGAAAVLVVWWLLAGRPHEVTVPASSGVEVAGAEPSAGATAGTLVVDVAGRVRRPGIVTLPPGSRVHEAIEAAGGTKGKVDTASLNLARVLTDGEQVVVGAPAAAPAGGASGPAGPADAVVNLNSADLVALDSLPGVGPVTAESIVAWREENGPFRSVDDLLDVKGIGEATLADLRDRVSV